MYIIDWSDTGDNWEIVLEVPTGDIIKVNIPKDYNNFDDNFFMNLVFKGDHYR